MEYTCERHMCPVMTPAHLLSFRLSHKLAFPLPALTPTSTPYCNKSALGQRLTPRVTLRAWAAPSKPSASIDVTIPRPFGSHDRARHRLGDDRRLAEGHGLQQQALRAFTT